MQPDVVRVTPERNDHAPHRTARPQPDALTALMDWVERRLLEWSKGSTDVPG